MKHRSEAQRTDASLVEQVTDSVLRFPRHRSAPFHAAWTSVDLAKFWLPSTSFSPRPTPIATHPDIVASIREAVSILSGRLAQSKTSHDILRSAVSVYARLFEYGWCVGCYSLRDFTPSHLQRLLNDLAEGGWYQALEIPRRVEELIRANPEAAQNLLNIKDGILQLRHAEVAKALGTCLSSRELRFAKCRLAEVQNLTNLPMRPREMRREPIGQTKLSYGNLASVLNWVNSLYDVTGQDRLLFVPYPNVSETSARLGRKGGRTPDLTPEHIAALLTESFRCIDQTGDALAAVCEELVETLDGRAKGGSDISSQSRRKVLHGLNSKLRLEEVVGSNITSVLHERGSNALSLYSVVEDVYTACFIVIGILNARRKDEIAGPGIGLMTDSLTLADPDLALHECDFYIEKTYHCRIPFFVGEATARAISLLKRLSTYAVEYHRILGDSFFEPPDAHSVFLMPFTGRAGRPQVYQFSACADKSAERLIRRALGDTKIQLGAHVFRRCYALLFHYRYENSDLLALTHQLAHFDVDAVRVYITDAAGGTACGRPFRRLTPQQRAGRVSELADVTREIDKVSDERMKIVSQEVIEGKARYSGGFARLVQRFHQKSRLNIQYRRLPSTEQAERLASSFVARGHKFKPMPHGNCVGSERAPNATARCFSAEQRELDRAEARPDLCATCPYHLVNDVHVNQLEVKLKTMESATASMPLQSVQREWLTGQIANLSRAIALHKSRLFKDLA